MILKLYKCFLPLFKSPECDDAQLINLPTMHLQSILVVFLGVFLATTLASGIGNGSGENDVATPVRSGMIKTTLVDVQNSFSYKSVLTINIVVLIIDNILCIYCTLLEYVLYIFSY